MNLMLITHLPRNENGVRELLIVSPLDEEGEGSYIVESEGPLYEFMIQERDEYTNYFWEGIVLQEME